MKRKVLAAMFVLLMSFGVANASQGPYVKGGFMFTNPTDVVDNRSSSYFYGTDVEWNVDSGVGIKFGMGYDFDGIRLDAEYQKHSNDVSGFSAYNETIELDWMGASADIDYQSFTLNVYKDFNISEKSDLYIGAGLGYGDIEASLSFFGVTDTDDDSGVVWKMGAGWVYNFTESVCMDIGYEYVDYNSIDFDGLYEDIASHNITAGIRYKF